MRDSYDYWILLLFAIRMLNNRLFELILVYWVSSKAYSKLFWNYFGPNFSVFLSRNILDESISWFHNTTLKKKKKKKRNKQTPHAGFIQEKIQNTNCSCSYVNPTTLQIQQT